MLRIKTYVRPQTLEAAWQLCQKKGSVVLGGMLWLKMQDRAVGTAIDLQDLGLDRIKETKDSYSIGAMVTLRNLETHVGLNVLTHGAMADSVKHIVGVQFRNVATVGGSIWGRFGFSDVLTLFMAIGAQVELYQGGVMTVEEFAARPRTERDLLVRVIVPKKPMKAVYLSQRNSATDFPVLTCALCERDGGITCAVGARPAQAVCLKGLPVDPEGAAEAVAGELHFGSNLRAGAEYRARICQALVRRGMTALKEQEG
ncbi:FAD binding domain-containing protein [Dysosmobacter sp.]|uniref:FAD binding domain-containing protein n=1 Tax=Dysosmobacter sp. TaxID=2591382 RepID=UPI002A96B04F|nr:FAD binding domain-containing protein [Dysosmobacter sp.]MDY5612426.1 FAD binding domain-containing protein [Dysosmobacter sp.]